MTKRTSSASTRARTFQVQLPMGVVLPGVGCTAHALAACVVRTNQLRRCLLFHFWILSLCVVACPCFGRCCSQGTLPHRVQQRKARGVREGNGQTAHPLAPCRVCLASGSKPPLHVPLSTDCPTVYLPTLPDDMPDRGPSLFVRRPGTSSAKRTASPSLSGGCLVQNSALAATPKPARWTKTATCASGQRRPEGRNHTRADRCRGRRNPPQTRTGSSSAVC